MAPSRHALARRAAVAQLLLLGSILTIPLPGARILGPLVWLGAAGVVALLVVQYIRHTRTPPMGDQTELRPDPGLIRYLRFLAIGIPGEHDWRRWCRRVFFDYAMLSWVFLVAIGHHLLWLLAAGSPHASEAHPESLAISTYEVFIAADQKWLLHAHVTAAAINAGVVVVLALVLRFVAGIRMRRPAARP